MKVIRVLFFTLTFISVDQLHCQPNIVFIVVDDAGYSDFGFTGSALISTPEIDGLVASGVRFDRAYVPAPYCAPTRAALLTGRHPSRYGFDFNITKNVPAPGRTILDVGLDAAERTLADELSVLGYTSAMIGKWHLGSHDLYHPLNRGFDFFYGFKGGGRSYFPIENPGEDQFLYRNWKADDLEEGFVTNKLTEEAISWMNQQSNSSKPFFLYLAYSAVHSPYQSENSDYTRFEGMDLTDVRKHYAALMINLDRNIGLLRKFLDQKGLTDNTVVVFVNDNGGPHSGVITNNKPLRGGKGTIYEGGIRVPMSISWSGHIPESVAYSYPVAALDLFPTLMELAGGEVQETIDGVSLVPVFEDLTLDLNNYMYWKKEWEYKGIIHQNKKLFIVEKDLYDDLDNDTLLFDLEKDPTEERNLFKAQRDEASVLLEKLLEFESQTKLPYWISEDVSLKLAESVCLGYRLYECPFILNYYFDVIGSLRVFPNPADQYLSIETRLPFTKVEIFSINGILEYRKELKDGTDQLIVDVSQFKRGLKLLRVCFDNNNYVSIKFTKN